MVKTKNAPKPVEDLTYEEALAELEGIVEALESDQNPLEEAMKLFERGQVLAAHCSVLLDSAQLKVQELVGESLLPFEEESND